MAEKIIQLFSGLAYVFKSKGWESRCTYVECNTKDVLFFLTAAAQLLKLQKEATRKGKKNKVKKQPSHHIQNSR